MAFVQNVSIFLSGFNTMIYSNDKYISQYPNSITDLLKIHKWSNCRLNTKILQNNICLRPKSCNAMSIIVHNKWNIILRNMTFAKPIICASLFSKNKRISGYTTNVICQIIYNEVTLNHNWNTHNSMQVFWEITQFFIRIPFYLLVWRHIV